MEKSTLPPMNSKAAFDTRERFTFQDASKQNAVEPLRDASDDQLQRVLVANKLQVEAFAKELTTAMARYGAARNFEGAVEMEIDRRRRTLAVAHMIPKG